MNKGMAWYVPFLCSGHSVQQVKKSSARSGVQTDSSVKSVPNDLQISLSFIYF